MSPSLALGSATPPSPIEQRKQRATHEIAERRPCSGSMGTHSFDQAPRHLHRKGNLGIANGKGPLQTPRLFEVPICLAGRDAPVPDHLLDSIGQVVELLQQAASSIEALGFEGVAGTAHMS